MATRTYEAMLARAENVMLVEKARRAVERVGGRLRITANAENGMTLVELALPEPYTAADFFPGIPFYLV